jgi:hypothetical protein
MKEMNFILTKTLSNGQIAGLVSQIKVETVGGTVHLTFAEAEILHHVTIALTEENTLVLTTEQGETCLINQVLKESK